MSGDIGWIHTKQEYWKAALEGVENADPSPNVGTRADCAPQDKNHTTLARDSLVGAAGGYCNGMDGDLTRTRDDPKGLYFSNHDAGIEKISIGIDFSEEQGGCKEAQTYDPTVDDCLSKLSSIVDDCMFHDLSRICDVANGCRSNELRGQDRWKSNLEY